jgi:threonine dehydrogenase-like Zn-dependent dehydrogenase
VSKLFGSNKGVKGSGASARHHITDLLPDVLNGDLDVSAIFTETTLARRHRTGYADMDQRRAVKVLISSADARWRAP